MEQISHLDIKIKLMQYKKKSVTTIFFLFLIFQVYGQTKVSQIGDKVKDYSDDIGGAISSMSSIGLAWSKIYTGPLIDIPIHFGIGFSLGASTIKMQNIEPVANEIMGAELNHDIADKLFLPSYVLDFRIGGFRYVPFDLGVKWGYLPTVPIMANDVKYECLQFGTDIRFSLVQEWARIPAISLGAGLDYINGALTHDGQMEIDVISGASETSLKFETYMITGKLGVSKTFFEPFITIFAEFKAGVAFGKAGYLFRGENLTVQTDAGAKQVIGSSADRRKIEEFLAAEQGQGAFTADKESISCLIDNFALTLNTCEGISFNFNNRTYLQLSVMFDFATLEYGGSFSFRYQQ
ncbi:MAG: hypothetical protein Ta2B_28790 [Termitinemataceae bacterium]|nr:MAG: hypothetical protein Ta2B_28790 [Termitinemataceae bacterium]